MKDKRGGEEGEGKRRREREAAVKKERAGGTAGMFVVRGTAGVMASIWPLLAGERKRGELQRETKEKDRKLS